MRILLSIMVGATVAATSLSATMSTAAAQSKSADDIIKALKPSGLIGSGTRGIRPSSSGAAAVDVSPQQVTAYTPQPTTSLPAPSAPRAATSSAPASRPVTTAAASVPRPAEPTAATAAAPSASLEVQFTSGSTELTSQAREALDQLGRALSSADLSAYRFRIEGHTDTVGSPDANRALSARRADVVVAYLNTKFGIASSRMQAVGRGSDQLAVATGAQVAESRNRRVMVVNIGA